MAIDVRGGERLTRDGDKALFVLVPHAFEWLKEDVRRLFSDSVASVFLGASTSSAPPGRDSKREQHDPISDSASSHAFCARYNCQVSDDHELCKIRVERSLWVDSVEKFDHHRRRAVGADASFIAQVVIVDPGSI